MFREKHDLPHVIGNMSHTSVDRLQHRMRLIANRYLPIEIRPASLSRFRSGCSPSVVRKSLHRDRILPDKCLSIVAVEFDSSSSAAVSFSSGTCAIAPLASRR